MRSVIITLLLLPSLFGQWYKSNLNLMSHPEDLSQSVAWEYLTISATYGVTDQGGGSTATRIAATATNANTAIRQQVWLPSGATYTQSAIAKINSGQWFEMGISDFTANACGQFFDLTNGALGSASAAGTASCGTANITSLGSGWYLCTFRVTIGTTQKYWIELRPTNGNNSYSTTSGQAIDLWQLRTNYGTSVLPYTSTSYNAKKFTYFGFAGTNPDIFITSQSTDGTTWDLGTVQGMWRGEHNAPDAMFFRNQWLFHVASPIDSSLSIPSWIFARADAFGAITDLATINYTGVIGSVTSCFSGSFFIDDDGSVHVLVPCSNSALTAFSVYETHPTNQASDPSAWTWSSPSILSGLDSDSIDPQVYKVDSTYYMLHKRDSNVHILLATASSLTGTWTEVQDLTTTESWGATNEGPAVYHINSATTWQIMFEQYTTGHTMQGSSCASVVFSCSGTWTTKTAWTQPSNMLYRHGTVVRTPGSNTGAALGIQ